MKITTLGIATSFMKSNVLMIAVALAVKIKADLLILNWYSMLNVGEYTAKPV